MDTKLTKQIKIAEPDLSGNELKYVKDAISKEKLISSFGKYLDKFEDTAKSYFGRQFALSCSNGTTALHLALLSLGVGHGDEVIVPTFTFAASVATIVQVGATPVFIDSKKDDWLLDENLLEGKRTPKTKAIIAVDLYGLPCNYDFILPWAEKNKIFVIEDAAEAHGAEYKNKRVGSFGDVSCFSFYGNKIITTGEGGMCLTDNAELFQKMKVLKNHGMKVPGSYEHEEVGYNYRLTNIQAAIGCAQFERIEEFLEKRRENLRLYKEYLGNIPEIVFQKYNEEEIKPANWLITILTNLPNKDLIEKLKTCGIDSRPVFKPMHLQKPYQKFAENKFFPVAESISKVGISLPSSVLLKKKDIKYVCDSIKDVLKEL